MSRGNTTSLRPRTSPAKRPEPSYFESRPFTPLTPLFPTRNAFTASHLGLMNNNHPSSLSLPPNFHPSNPNCFYLPQVGVVKFPPPALIRCSAFSASSLNLVAAKSTEVPDPLTRERAMFRKLMCFATSKRPLPAPTAKVRRKDSDASPTKCLEPL